ncbi:MAG TPA: cation-translocating P-type ATPase [Candidatus Poseidoniales archaeon]|nr:MAG: hypothetical protein CXT69_01500 [Euryarchaeota archaeon]HIG03139.1 cation-translocating P-type ATPase [Candidatus Poseidoniales archaeon]HIK77972.1 cation-translocating P-type ATPase [Candidatus Poseidoniales archaeon]
MSGCHATSTMPKGDEGEDFLFLEDEIAVPPTSSEAKNATPITATTSAITANKQAGIKLEMLSDENNIQEITEPVEVLTPFDDLLSKMSIAGVEKVGWGLRGLDCPDCAMKATKALLRLPSVEGCEVSATNATVSLDFNFEAGSIYQVNSILTSLGHAPEIEWLEMGGVNATRLGERLSMDMRRLEKMLKNQPGLLDVDITSDERIIIQVPIDSSSNVVKARNDALQNLTGREIELHSSTSIKLRPDQKRLIGAGIAIPLMLIALVLELTSSPPWALAIVGLPGVIIGGRIMFMEAWASIRNRQLGFQILTSLAVIGACWLGAWTEALLVVVLEALTSHMEGDALVKARKAMQGGLDRLPRTARLLNEAPSPSVIAKGFDISSLSEASALTSTPSTPLHSQKLSDGFEEVPLELIQLGDKVEVRSGELIPVDGKIVEGIGSLDKAPLTGESLPVRVTSGDIVEAGLVLKRGPIVIVAIAVGEDTRLSGLIEQVHTFRDQPPRLQSLVEVFTAIWIPIVLIGAPLAWFLSGDVSNWKIMLLLWVVACPCALLLAAPIPHAASLSNAAHQGMIVRGGDVLERTARVNLALLDKTGTLTSGHPRLNEVIIAKGKKMESIIRLASGLELRSNHPYAAVIRNHANELNLNPSKITGLTDAKAGVHGKFSSKKVMIGRMDWLLEEGIEIPEEIEQANLEAQISGYGVSVLARDGKALALLSFVHDDVRNGAGQLIRDLYSMKINIELLSGDTSAAVANFGPSIGIPEAACRGEMDPESKASWVEGRANTHIVLMAGDGFNDSTALAKSDVGVAVGSGEQVNLDAADVLIPSEDPQQLSRLIAIARRARAVVRQNIIISVGVTAILVWTVLSGINDQIWIGVLAHEASAILVILNSARLSGNSGTIALLRDLFIGLFYDTKKAFIALLAQRASM